MTTLMIDKPKGGRGHTAPYETKQMRVPEPLEPQIQELISRYRDWISEAGARTVGANNPPLLLDKSLDTSKEPVDKLKQDIENLTKLVDNLRTDNAALDAEVNRLHGLNGELNLEILELKEQSKPVDKLNGAAGDLRIKPVDKLINTALGLVDKPVDKLSNSKPSSLSQRDLAKRLGVSHTTIGRKQKEGKLTDWSCELDPDQLRWRLDPESKLYCPVD